MRHPCRENDGNPQPALTIPNLRSPPCSKKREENGQVEIDDDEVIDRVGVKVMNEVESVGNLFEESVRVEDPAFADGEEEEDGDDAEGGLHLRPHVDSDRTTEIVIFRGGDECVDNLLSALSLARSLFALAHLASCPLRWNASDASASLSHMLS